MLRARTILAIILVALGLVWVGQGTGVLAGTGFMVGDAKWAVIGAVMIVAGLGLGWAEIRRRGRA
jgi:hypothetical protein